VSHTVRGLVPILATPMLAGGQLDLASLRRLTEFQLESGVDGVAVFGMAGEGFALTADERVQILDEVRTVIAGSVPIVAGVAATSTTTAISQIRIAEEHGAVAVMVLPPYLVKPDQAGVIEFYAQVAAESSTEVMVQDAPGVTGVPITLSSAVELSKIAGVTSVKIEAPPTPPKVGSLVEMTEPEFAVLGGMNAQLVVDEYLRGSVGTMPACEFSDRLAPIVADLLAGRVDHARRAHTELLPLVLFGLQPGIAWAVHKHVLVMRGLIAHATVRAPARPLDHGSQLALSRILQSLAMPGPETRR
jgi:2-keto-3-deoxy-L-arabinonate dehydratase